MLRAADITLRTDTGRQRRDNEDSAFARAPLFVVADGMGGAQAGEVASRLAVETFEDGLDESEAPERRLAARVREANRRIHELSRTDTERAGMGTTLTAALLEEHDLAIAHVGDSRAYMYRDGHLQRLTRDHSLVDELMRRGKLTEEQAAEHPQRSIITRALGPEAEVEVDTWTYPVRPGDVLLLCSDGLTSMLSEDQVEAIIARAPNLVEAGDELVDAANAAGGRDNITVVLFRVEDTDASGEEGMTMVGVPAPGSTGDTTTLAAPVAPPQRSETTALRPLPARHAAEPRAPVESRRRAKAVAAVLAVLVVLAIILGGGYLATRQLYFVGTDSRGLVTIYRGLPYTLPAGIDLYETYYESGYPAALIPAARRGAILDNHLRSEADASRLVRQLELGNIAK
jgi:protein phosphatase